VTAHESHPQTAEHPEQIRVILLAGLVSVIILVILLVWLRSYFFLVRNETVEKNYLEAGNPKIEELHAREKALLTSYGWVNKGKGIVHVPVDRAMELMVEEAARGGTSPASSTPPEKKP
jgi:hypothetical protein